MRSRVSALAVVLSVVVVVWGGPSLSAQDAEQDVAGFPLNGIFDGGSFDSVAVKNGNLHIEIPDYTIKGRANLDVGTKFVYDSLSWRVHTRCNNMRGCTATVSLGLGIDATFGLVHPLAYVLASGGAMPAGPCGSLVIGYGNYKIQEPNGTLHHFVPDPAVPTPNTACGPLSTLYADDGSGFVLHVDNGGNVTDILDKSGNHVNGQAGLVEDTNGNTLTIANNVITDTTGRTYATDGSYKDSSGTLQSVQITTTAVTTSTHLCQFGIGYDQCNESSNTLTLPQTITLPSGATYQFTYVPAAYGQPSSVTLPTGGQISWGWGAPLGPGGPVVTSRTETANSVSHTRKYSYATTGTPPYLRITADTVTDVIGTSGNDTVYTFSPLANPVDEEDDYQGSSSGGTFVRKVLTGYTTINGGGLYPVNLPTSITTTWVPQGISKQVQTDYYKYLVWTSSLGSQLYATWRNPTEIREYDYTSALIRSTDYAYLHNNPSSPYFSANIADRPYQKLVFAGSSTTGALTEQTKYQYDTTSLTSTSHTPAPNHDYTNYGSGNTVRGNLTELDRGLLSGGTWTFLSTINTFDDLGNELTSKDPLSHMTTMDYTDSYADSACSLGTNTFAYATKVTNPLFTQGKDNYYSCTGLLQSQLDANDINNSRNGTVFGYDSSNRVSSISYSDGGSATYSHTDTSPVSTSQTTKVTSSLSKTETTVLDSIGRVDHTQTTNPDCSSGVSTVAYTYGDDSTNQVRYITKTNPYCSTSDATYGTETDRYDELNRLVQQVRPDLTVASVTYAGNCSTTTDEAGKSVKRCSDGLGRLAQVIEDPTGLAYETDYGYDVLDNLVAVTQKGGSASNWRLRSFNYDSLSRLKCAANPEVTSSAATPASCPTTDTGSQTAGTTYHTYDADGNLSTKTAPAPNQTLSATATTSYSYDQLDRLTAKTYSGGASTPSVQYGYDTTTLTCTPPVPTMNPPDANSYGSRTSMCDGSGATAWSHDALGRILRAKRTNVGSSNSSQVFAYTYNYDGSLATLQYPSGRTITHTPNQAGLPKSAFDGANGINYVTGATYGPQGALTYYQNYSLINAAFSYNTRLQPLQIFYGTNSVPNLTGSTCPSNPGNELHRVYHFGLGSNDNGDVLSIDNCLDTNRTVTYVYDSLNRVESATTKGATCVPGCWGQLFGQIVNGQYVSGYDGWGNLFQITPTQGTPGQLSQLMTQNNQFSGMTYDAAGNLNNDGGGNAYTFDDENRVVAAAGWTYAYDGDGNRTRKCNACTSSSGGTLYWYGAGNSSLVESNLAGTLTWEYIFFNGRRVARRDNTSNPPTFYFADHLGSTSIVSGSAGVVKNESDYTPFGAEISIKSNLGVAQGYKFTGKERDSESELDEFGARYYRSSIGRFMSPDLGADVFALPFASLKNPQTLNLYSYVGNNPVTNVDRDGHDFHVCVDNGKGGQNCIDLTNAQYNNLYNQQNGQQGINLPGGGFGSSGTDAYANCALSQRVG